MRVADGRAHRPSRSHSPPCGNRGLAHVLNPLPQLQLPLPQEWAAKVLAHRESVVEAEPEAVQTALVESVKDHPLYGTCFFHVRKHKFPEQMESFPEHCIVALNSEGLHFLSEERETLASFGYADVYRWGGSSTSFSLIW